MEYCVAHSGLSIAAARKEACLCCVHVKEPSASSVAAVLWDDEMRCFTGEELVHVQGKLISVVIRQTWVIRLS